ncbi:hypothetical protein ACRALDRAFT_2042456 [Sodiomyces alcalophilus JCM 7366]|uniref:uncharacterized protein n=1 Tax=Sodiomyces alcalophilus JCM 7366 TaxID=591952 RepID=UPI0039B6B2E3
MGLRGILRKKGSGDKDVDVCTDAAAPAINAPPEFKFIRSDTHAQDPLQPSDHNYPSPRPPSHHQRGFLAASSGDPDSSHRSRSASLSSQASATSTSTRSRPRSHRRLSERLYLSRSPSSSEHVPQNLPDITPGDGPDHEGQWEHRATMLASAAEMARSRPVTPTAHETGRGRGAGGFVPSPGPSPQPVSSKDIDEDIQEAIRLHEEGDLARSTAMFRKLADPNGANNPLSQVLYGLALRHGWGCQPDVTTAVRYLTAAASNAAAVEELALQAGLKKGGAAKGELVLAIFELGNSFRHGWGTNKDPIAAKQYYETAANLGDTDAMNETGWCYLEGFGCKKDKHTAARYYRMAEKNGHKTLGNSWIWKEKYDPPEEGGGGKKKKK